MRLITREYGNIRHITWPIDLLYQTHTTLCVFTHTFGLHSHGGPKYARDPTTIIFAHTFQ